MRILLLGARGQVGTELLPVLGTLGHVTALARGQADLRDGPALRARILEARPDVLVNAAAYTAVDLAEREPDLALRINGDAVGDMAHCMRELGGLLVHYSTDYVFDGRAGRPYTEEDRPAPLNRYGHSKLAGEVLVRQSGVRHIILRISWVYAQHGKNFLRTVLRLAAERDVLRVVADQVGAPTCARQVAQATAEVLRQCQDIPRGDPSWDKWGGTYHYSAAGAVSWHGFACEILRLHHRGRLPERLLVQAISTEEFGAPAARPACSLLDNAKLRQRFGIQSPDWAQALRDCMALLPP